MADAGEDTVRPFEFQPEHDGSLPIKTAVFQALGAASTCWRHVERAGVFESERAEEIGNALMAEIEKEIDRRIEMETT